MASTKAKGRKSKMKLSQAVEEEVRFLKLAIANHERASASSTGELKTYFERKLEKNRTKLAELTGKA